MKHIILGLVMMSGIGLISAQKTTINDFAWLEGTWVNIDTKAPKSAHEVWYMHDSGYLEGTGVTLRNGDTVFIEKLKIVEKEGDYYYVATVAHNAGPVYFKITEHGPGHFTSENPEHDFPKKITYNYEGDVLVATISAGSKSIPFRFRKNP